VEEDVADEKGVCLGTITIEFKLKRKINRKGGENEKENFD